MKQISVYVKKIDAQAKKKKKKNDGSLKKRII